MNMIVNDPCFFSVSSIEPGAYCMPRARVSRRVRHDRKNRARINRIVWAFGLFSMLMLSVALIA
ncbi:hypothetical protein GOZ97_20655 [Agrobacterium vitis]|uniref:Uncharacterized protein n=1 Tax=Agrobacterium vitis TaxID=373 RepID=A0ABD6HED3_AGRVI|nr:MULTISPECIES: hypothetical protein [Rhizobium/Agrobacterium group]MCF1433100.1 hypothetical protein [Allorhizobium ampelinum]MCF1463283.1 hypothetical protein [Allorhizobium ampelinum]MUO26418.1 hypothetical protein [Agrobacterium vitis]MUO44402.1 hypothetical protein [Agrobacterium vitis]MUO92333.1 hypothetical protein [Agrobacterium vitis]